MHSYREKLAEFIRHPYQKKIDSFNLLIEAGNEILETENSRADKSEDIYYLERIATELHLITVGMSFSKKYDIASLLKTNYEYAFKFALRARDGKWNRDLLPYVSKLLYYEQFLEPNDRNEYLPALYERCLEDLERYNTEMKQTEQPWYVK